MRSSRIAGRSLPLGPRSLAHGFCAGPEEETEGKDKGEETEPEWDEVDERKLDSNLPLALRASDEPDEEAELDADDNTG